MKTLTILPILAAGANKKNENDERGYDGWGQTSDISQYSEECSQQVPSRNGIFETANYGTSGEITLDEYSHQLRCKHDVQADSSCSEIKISYRSIAVMMDYGFPMCAIDGFRFGWTDNETGDFSLTPLRCDCFGDGCDDDDFGDYFLGEYDGIDHDDYYQDQHVGPDEFTIKSNSFTLYFETAWAVPWTNHRGHVILDWECVATITTTATTTSTTTT